MASTNKTPNLRLNSWLDSDRPKRMDFVSDNNIIDSTLGTHLNDSTSHLTPSEKDKVDEPFEICILYGTGETSTSITFDFNPLFVMAYKINSPASEYVNSKNMVNTAYAARNGTSLGISLSNNQVTFYQGNVPDTNYYNNMNKSNSQYVVIAFK
ncbi:MAG: hypothetical protein IJ932_05100 [Ruminococcus sp.]|nr:hypothetical protein [Ruminococcus sp.]